MVTLSGSLCGGQEIGRFEAQLGSSVFARLVAAKQQAYLDASATAKVLAPGPIAHITARSLPGAPVSPKVGREQGLQA